MKSKIIIMVGIIFLAGCTSNKEKAQTMLQETEMRSEIYQAIQNDSARLRDMIVSIVSVDQNPQNFPMRYRMIRLALNSPVVDSLLVNDDEMRTRLLQKLLTETDHNISFREETSRAVQRHESLMNDIRKNPKAK